MKLATFNVENLFSRVAAFNLPDWSDGRPILEAFAKVSDLLQRKTYSPAVKNQIIAGLTGLELDKSDRGGGLVILRQNRDRLVKRPHNKPMEVIADGRADWIGWLELKEEPINDIAINNTPRVFGEVDADIWGVVEAEHRPGLIRFNKDLIEEETGSSYPVVMLIDGNDTRKEQVRFCR